MIELYRELSAEAAAAKAQMQAIARRAVSLKETAAYLREPSRMKGPPPLLWTWSNSTPQSASSFPELGSGAVTNKSPSSSVLSSPTDAPTWPTRSRALNGRSPRENDVLPHLKPTAPAFSRFLRSGGALDDFVDLQRLLSDAEAEAATLRERFKAAEALEQQTT